MLVKDIKSAVLNMLHELKETIGKSKNQTNKLIETRKMMYEQNVNINKERAIIKRNKRNCVAEKFNNFNENFTGLEGALWFPQHIQAGGGKKDQHS